MASISISVTVADANSSTTQTVTANQDVVTISSLVVAPQTAASGTSRTLTVQANSSAGATLTFNAPVATGITFTPVSGQPAGQAQWTFTY